MSGLNPKNLPLTVSAANEAARADLSVAALLVVTIVFSLIATIGVGTPVLLSFVLGDRANDVLTQIREWMTAHNAAIMIVLFTVLGAKSLGQGISALAQAHG